MYKNIVFDLGGVVFNYDPAGYLKEEFGEGSVADTIMELTFASQDWYALDRGDISLADLNERFIALGEERGIANEMRIATSGWVNTLVPKKDTLALMQRLKQEGYTLYYLSNIGGDMLKRLSRHSFWSIFTGGVASYEIGVLKPDERMYRELLSRYALEPAETIFTDDMKKNAQAATALGITGIHFKDAQDFEKALRACNVIDN